MIATTTHRVKGRLSAEDPAMTRVIWVDLGREVGGREGGKDSGLLMVSAGGTAVTLG